MGTTCACLRATQTQVGAPLTAAQTALLILDMISDFGFPDGERVLRAALPAAARIARLKRHALGGSSRGAPVARRVVLCGVTAQQCVLFTANDAYVRDLEVAIPRDCVASESPAKTKFALRYFREVLGADLAPSPRIRFGLSGPPRL